MHATATTLDRPIVTLALESIQRHPHNRRIEPAAVTARAESLLAHGQLEPIEVRRLWLEGTGSIATAEYEIVSGETRWLAAQELGWGSIEARIRDDLDDAGALELLALYNSQRQDLDPIQQAELIERLCAKPHDGGAGLTRLQAAQRVGLESGAAASNLVKLLELDEPWRARLVEGKISQKVARVIARFSCVPGALVEAFGEAFDDANRNEWADDHEFQDEDEAERGCQQRAVELLEPIEGFEVSQERYGIAGYGHVGCMFKWQDHAAALNIVDLPASVVPSYRLTGRHGSGPKTIKAALNQPRYRELQAAAIEKHRSKSKAKQKAGAAKGNGKPTAGTKAAIAKMQKSTRKPLADRVAVWREQWLRRLLAAELAAQPYDWRALKLFFYLVARQSSIQSIHSHTHDALAAGTVAAGVRKSRPGFHDECWPAYHAAIADATPGKPAGWRLAEMVRTACQSALVGDDKQGRAPSYIRAEALDDLARDYGLDLAQRWSAEQTGSGLSDNQVVFLNLHTLEELTLLAKGWGLTPNAQHPLKGTKGSVVKSLAMQPARGRSLPLPAIIKPLASEAKPKPRKRKPKAK